MTIASDYAHIQGGDIEAYYGYEFTKTDHNTDWDDDPPEWGFWLKKGGVEVMRVPFSELRRREKRLDQEETAECLLVGLETYWEREKG